MAAIAASWEEAVNAVIPQNDTHGVDRMSAIDVVSRFATVIRNAKLDCECRLRLDQTLVRFMALERRRVVRRNLSDARTQRDRIEAFLVFLTELDELESTEPDQSVYKEMSLLFDDIASAAEQGAELMRQLSSSSLSA